MCIGIHLLSLIIFRLLVSSRGEFWVFHDAMEPGVIRSIGLQGLQSDREFAETFARSRWRQYRWAASRIRIELMKKGVSKEDSQHALYELFGNEHTVRMHNDTIDEHDLEGEAVCLDEQYSLTWL